MDEKTPEPVWLVAENNNYLALVGILIRTLQHVASGYIDYART
jgi:hypothetical protein